MSRFDEWVDRLPLIAILRGVKPDEVEAVGDVLVEAGFGMIEVPMNSPEPFQSIEILSRKFAPDVIIGAGTVFTTSQIDQVRQAGGNLIVMPHGNLELVSYAKKYDLTCIPGAATPTEAFSVLNAGADGVKIFPAEAIPPKVLKAWRAVMPSETCRLFPVGGISPETMGGYLKAWATGFGLGSALYRPGASPEETGTAAEAFVTAYRQEKLV